MSEKRLAAWVVNIEITRIDEDGGDSCEEARMERYDIKTLHKCPQCGWLNYTVDDWGDGEIYCENPDCPRIRSRTEEAHGEHEYDYIYCATCERWIAADTFPRHLIGEHLRLPKEAPYDIIPGQELAHGKQ